MRNANNINTSRRSAGRLICDLFLLIIVLALTASTFLFFVTPVVQVGGKASYGETQNIFTFIWFGEDSAIKQFINLLDQVNNVDIATDGSTVFVMGYYTLIRLACLVISSGILVLVAGVNVLSALFRFFRGRSEKLIETVLSTLRQCLNLLFAFACFGALDNGAGSFYAGYTLSLVVKAGVFAALLILLIIALVRFIADKKSCLIRNVTTLSFKNERRAWLRAFWLALGYTAIAAVLSLARLDYFCTQTFNIWFNSVLVSIMTGFDITSFIVPVIFFVLSVCLSCFATKSQKGVVNCYKHLLAVGPETIIYKKHSSVKGMAGVIVATIISLACTFALCYPAWGFGLPVTYYYYCAAIFAAATIGQAFAALFTVKN